MGEGRLQQDVGFGMVSLIASLVVLGLLGAIAAKSLEASSRTTDQVGAALATGAGAAPSAGDGGLAGEADDLVAQQNLRSVLTLVDEVALTVGGYGAVTAAELTGPGRGGFTPGPSTAVSLMSVAASGGSGGAVTLAVASTSGICWFAWRSDDATRYGAEAGHPRCAAMPLASAPQVRPVAAGAIDWQLSTFPSP